MSQGSRISSLTQSSRPLLDDIRRWFRSSLGRHLFNTEAAMLEQLLQSFFGYHLVQLSIQEESLYGPSPIRHKLNINLDIDLHADLHAHLHSKGYSGLVASPGHLPFANDNIDVVLLHHLLDYVDSPRDVLREAARVVLPMGHLVIVGFHPVSSWGLWRQVARFRGRAPWTGRFIRAGRLMDWLNLLEFKIDRAQYAIYRPPIVRYPGKVNDYSRGVSRNLNLPIGSVYVIVAQKHMGAITPMRPVWKRSRAFGRLSVVRSVSHDGLKNVAGFHET